MGVVSGEWFLEVKKMVSVFSYKKLWCGIIRPKSEMSDFLLFSL